MDFLFAFVLIMGSAAVLFALSLSLSVTEVLQYATFAASRSYLAAHKTPQDQERIGMQKFKQILGAPGLKQILKASWFEAKPKFGEFAQLYKSEGTPSFYGVRTEVRLLFLDFEVPFLGSTASEDAQGFKTATTSFIGREPTSSECTDFSTLRYQYIQKLDGRFSQGIVSQTSQAYVPVIDDGC